MSFCTITASFATTTTTETAASTFSAISTTTKRGYDADDTSYDFQEHHEQSHKRIKISSPVTGFSYGADSTFSYHQPHQPSLFQQKAPIPFTISSSPSFGGCS